MRYDKSSYTEGFGMPATKVAVTIDSALLAELDRWVAAGEFPNRSQAVQAGVRRLQEDRRRRGRLLDELSKLDPEEERALADEILTADELWPEY
jgi:Arc/MetJ-type ribon-helix-helix transcriptional regulator